MGWEKWRAGARERKSYYGEPIGSHQRSFEWYHPRPLQPPLPLDWGSQPPTKTPNCYYRRNG